MYLSSILTTSSTTPFENNSPTAINLLFKIVIDLKILENSQEYVYSEVISL